MINLINKTIGIWRGFDGKFAEVEMGGVVGYQPNWDHVDALAQPREKICTALELDTGARINLPTNEIAHILSDRTGVLVLFSSKRILSEECIAYPAPDNAAIFNADGSLRFRLKNPHGEQGHFRAVTNNTAKDGSPALGVRACPKDWPVCESVYLVDGSTDDLSQQIPKWVRD